MLKIPSAYAAAFVSLAFSILPESFFGKHEWITGSLLEQCGLATVIEAQVLNIVIARLLFLLIVWLFLLLLFWLYLIIRRKVIIKGDNYSISVEYGNIFNARNCKKVFSFDECFTTHVGEAVADVNPMSICGQYLTQHRNLDIEKLIQDAGVEPSSQPSEYKNMARYDSGTIVPNGDDLLMAFVQLDERGKGRFFSRDDYLRCLDLLWRELEYYYSEKDVCVPILGSGTTSFDGVSGASFSKQDLLNMMILSYKLSSHKIKDPHKLRIICKRSKGFSINRINA